MRLCCPDCGSDLRIRPLDNGLHVCECQTPEPGCRAASKTGKTPDKAADNFVLWCEQRGYTVALAEKMAGIIPTDGSR